MSVPLYRVLEAIDQFKKEVSGLQNGRCLVNALDEVRERIECIDMRNWTVREHRPEGIVEKCVGDLR